MGRLTDELMNSVPWKNTEERAEWWRNKCYEVFEELEHYRYLEEQGRLIAVIRCKDCRHEQYCKQAQYLGADGYCSKAEVQNG